MTSKTRRTFLINQIDLRQAITAAYQSRTHEGVSLRGKKGGQQTLGPWTPFEICSREKSREGAAAQSALPNSDDVLPSSGSSAMDGGTEPRHGQEGRGEKKGSFRPPSPPPTTTHYVGEGRRICDGGTIHTHKTEM